MKLIKYSISISRNFFTSLLIVSSLLSFSSVLADARIIGEWQGIDSDGDPATFIFNEDKSAEILFGGLPPLTSKNILNGEVKWSSAINDNTIEVDVLIITESVVTSRIVMIASATDTKTLKIQMSRDMKTRPTDFEMNEREFQIITTKQ